MGTRAILARRIFPPQVSLNQNLPMIYAGDKMFPNRRGFHSNFEYNVNDTGSVDSRYLNESNVWNVQVDSTSVTTDKPILPTFFFSGQGPVSEFLTDLHFALYDIKRVKRVLMSAIRGRK